ncbi:MAG TPA: UDP-3-O-(3-hydroxymyristoyl)glucosamine N-acyltransferase [Candidatus Acidoferrales bacterium]|nr:UDP-3-O-(3-hydroxymyristoyl)glucosamine N-acyltransferase [Candidatus Acidoferrales bacterium]
MIYTASMLAQYLEAELEGNPEQRVAGVAGPERARPEDLIYCEGTRHLLRAEASRAGTALAPVGLSLPGKTVLRVKDPKLAFAQAASFLAPPAPVACGIHPTAVIAPGVRMGPGAAVGAYAVIEEDVEIGPRSEIGAFCYLGRGSVVGAECRLYPRVTLYPRTRLRNRVIVHAGAVIGSDGFGYVRGADRQWKFPQVGDVEIGDDVEIGANTTIDRGSLGTTYLGRGVKIDNLVQVAHNVTVGEDAVIAAQTGISGSSIIGSDAVIGGQVGIADHCVIENGAVCGAQAGIPTGKKIRSGQVVWGTPARPLDKFKEQYAWFARLPELAERLRRLEKKAAEG